MSANAALPLARLTVLDLTRARQEQIADLAERGII